MPLPRFGHGSHWIFILGHVSIFRSQRLLPIHDRCTLYHSTRLKSRLRGCAQRLFIYKLVYALLSIDLTLQCPFKTTNIARAQASHDSNISKVFCQKDNLFSKRVYSQARPRAVVCYTICLLRSLMSHESPHKISLHWLLMRARVLEPRSVWGTQRSRGSESTTQTGYCCL